MLSPSSMADEGVVRSAINVDLSPQGAFSRRQGFNTIIPGTGFTSMHAIPLGLIVGRGTELFLIKEPAFTTHHIYGMGAEGPLDFTEYNGHLYIVGQKVFCWLPEMKGMVRRVGVTLPDRLPLASSHGAGNLTAGNYAVAISCVDDRGEESPTTMLGNIHLTGGLRLENIEVRPGYKYRVYLSHPDGSEMYLSAEFAADTNTFFAMTAPDGALRATQHLAPMPPGDFVRGDKGRLYVAAGDTLWYSDAMRPHLTDPRTNFIKFTGEIKFVEPVNLGMYVGDSAGVWWLAGTDPSKFSLQSVSDAVPLKRSSLTLLTSNLGPNFAKSENNAAVWLSTHGYMVGSVEGKVTPLHPERVRLAADLEGKSAFVVRHGIKQIITLTAAAQSQQPTFGVATDTPLQ